MLNNRDVITSYKNCERTGGRRLLVFGLLGTLTDYANPHPNPTLTTHLSPFTLTLTLTPDPHPNP